MASEILTTMPLNDWVDEASSRETPKMLFSEFWFEGEISILFADTNLGKSILAFQIADSISKGKAITGFKLEAKKQKVIYCDFELSSKQVQNRYSDNYKNDFKFNDNFLRCSFNDNIIADQNDILSEIEIQVVNNESKILIIDNITFLNQETEKAKYALDLMQRLKTMKNKYNLSILILAHTPKRNFDRPITNIDLGGSKMLSNFCDSAFAIGQSYHDTSLRYIKQIKQRNCEQIYHQGNIITCKIDKGENNNFLQFRFLGFDNEFEHLNTNSNHKEAQDAKIAELKKEGKTNKEIGEIFGLTEGAIRKRVKKLARE
ncbi:AAA family ATPase [Pedobacter sp. SG908]|uniref:AAA family ATPase n=1 Tax=Pedobacter sp. SG908 TaxID=2587135 RepID=UPI0014216B5B|nr:AAA family ATPase [Pedobacter sp. SG908]NII81200.1 hypothetical protein [Pedobacter sp. SG908]